jgi:hypothetical protein
VPQLGQRQQLDFPRRPRDQWPMSDCLESNVTLTACQCDSNVSDACTNGLEPDEARRKRRPEGGVLRQPQRSPGVTSMHESASCDQARSPCYGACCARMHEVVLTGRALPATSDRLYPCAPVRRVPPALITPQQLRVPLTHDRAARCYNRASRIVPSQSFRGPSLVNFCRQVETVAHDGSNVHCIHKRTLHSCHPTGHFICTPLKQSEVL